MIGFVPYLILRLSKDGGGYGVETLALRQAQGEGLGGAGARAIVMSTIAATPPIVILGLDPSTHTIGQRPRVGVWSRGVAYPPFCICWWLVMDPRVEAEGDDLGG